MNFNGNLNVEYVIIRKIKLFIDSRGIKYDIDP